MRGLQAREEEHRVTEGDREPAADRNRRRELHFGPFALDPENDCLRRGDEQVSLTSKAFAVLKYLVERSERLVLRQELLEAVWPDTYVSEHAVTVQIREIRRALGDEPDRPAYIQTRHRRGYRFIAEVREMTQDYITCPSQTAGNSPQSLFERENALAQLHRCFDLTRDGSTQTVFITGEPGIGKTALVETFLRELRDADAEPAVWIGRGQCLESAGPGEPYLPVFEALSRLCRDARGGELISVLKTCAPTWLAEMPGLLTPAQRRTLFQEALGATRDRMLREMADALEAVTADRVLILVLEDLHWGDMSTVDLVSYVARRQSARVLLIGTYRPVDVIIADHPLRTVKQDLEVKGLCRELPLELLSVDAVSSYLSTRCGSHPHDAAGIIHRRTEGNPLFVVNVADFLLDHGMLLPSQGQESPPLASLDLAVPESLRLMIEKNLDLIPSQEQRVVETGSLVGLKFSAFTVADTLEASVEDVEECCDAWVARQQFLCDAGIIEFPNGQRAACYKFRHSLYREVLAARVGGAAELRLHQRIGESLERVYGERNQEVAADLAAHFERSNDYRRAVRYLRAAAQGAARRCANSEAVDLLHHALDICPKLPDPYDSEIALVTELGLIHRGTGEMTKAAAYFEAAADRAEKEQRPAEELEALLYLASAESWHSRTRCLAASARAVDVSRTLCNPVLSAHAQSYFAYWNLLFCGWDERDAQVVETTTDLMRSTGNLSLVVAHSSRLIYFQCMAGQYRKAWSTAQESIRLALDAGCAFEHQLSHYYGAWALLHLGEWGEMMAVLQNGIAFADKNYQPIWALLFRLQKAWLHIEALDFAGAYPICEAGYKEACELGHDFSQLMSLILAGLCELGLGRPDRTIEWFLKSREGIVMDWIWQMPLRLGLSEAQLASGNLPQARLEVARLMDATSLTSEITWKVVAQVAACRISLAEQNLENAKCRLSAGFNLLKGAEAPLATWRAHFAAAEFEKCKGKPAQAERHYRAGRAVIDGLAASLCEYPELRKSLVRLSGA